jgi:RimJ/RimL family protein N-acetyltransferase
MGAPTTSSAHSFDADAVRRQFLDGLMHQVGLGGTVCSVPGATVVGRDDRAGTGQVACYRVDRHLIVWADPAVVDHVPAVDHLTDSAGAPLPDDGVDTALRAAGFEFVAAGVMRTLVDVPDRPAALPHRFRLRPLDAAVPEHVAAIRSFIESSDPDELDLAGLADFGDFMDFDEIAINVVEDLEASAVPIVAYSSAMDWSWDPHFADIAVLVHPSARGLGLARTVAATTVNDLLDMDRLPLYRYRADNVASARVAAAVGFVPATTHTVHCRATS